MKTRIPQILNLLMAPLCALALAILAPAARAADGNPPDRMSFQGYLTDATGTALGNTAPKNYDVVFRIYDALTSGNRVWSELQTVTVDKGSFSVLLGEGTTVSGETRPAVSSLFAGATASDRYVEITVKGAGTSDTTITPRLRLLTAPYAYLARQATVASSLGSTTNVLLTLVNNQILFNTTNFVGMGASTTPPLAPLDIFGGYGASGGLNECLRINAGFNNVAEGPAIGFRQSWLQGAYIPTWELAQIGAMSEGGGGRGGVLSFRVNGATVGSMSEAMRITSGDKVLIGTINNPGDGRLIVSESVSDSIYNAYLPLCVSGPNTAQRINVGYDQANDCGMLSAYHDSVGFRPISFTRGTSVGIGTPTPANALHVYGCIEQDAPLGWGDAYLIARDGVVRGGIGTSQDGNDLHIFTGGTSLNLEHAPGNSRICITGSGMVGIDLTSPAYPLHVNGRVACVQVVTTSDARLKKDVKPIAGALSTVKALRGVTFNWDQTVDPAMKLDDRNHVGFIAQEVEAVLPQAVSTAADARQTKSVSYNEVVPVLVEAVKEQQAQIAQLNKTVAELKAAVEALKAAK